MKTKQSIKEILAPGHSLSYRWYRIRELWCLKTLRIDWLMWALIASYLAFGVFCYLTLRGWSNELKKASPDTQLIGRMLMGMLVLQCMMWASSKRK